MGSLKVIANRVEDLVVCTLPDGEEVEIEMLSACGSEVDVEANVNDALDVLQCHLRNQYHKPIARK